jgi:hypothetical protein
MLPLTGGVLPDALIGDDREVMAPRANPLRRRPTMVATVKNPIDSPQNRAHSRFGRRRSVSFTVQYSVSSARCRWDALLNHLRCWPLK